MMGCDILSSREAVSTVPRELPARERYFFVP